MPTSPPLTEVRESWVEWQRDSAISVLVDGAVRIKVAQDELVGTQWKEGWVIKLHRSHNIRHRIGGAHPNQMGLEGPLLLRREGTSRSMLKMEMVHW